MEEPKSKYKAIKVDGVKYDEHRYIMEQKLGRKLRRDEVVHHINEDARDNDIANLCIMSLADHGRLHQLGKKLSPETREKISMAITGTRNEHTRKLTEEQVRYIREHYIPRDREFGTRALSRRFNTHHSTVERIVHGKIYRDFE